MFFFLRLSTSPRGAALGCFAELRALRWLLCAFVPAWLCLSAGLANAAVSAAVPAAVPVSASGADEGAGEPSGVGAERAGAGATGAEGAAGDAASPGAADEGAPMCDPRGASVLALPEIPVVDHGKLEQLPCDDAWLRWLGATLAHARSQAAARDGVPANPPPELQVTRVRVDGVLPLVHVMPERGEPQRLPPSEAAGLAARPGHRFSIYRPPVRGR